ncbi:tail fiber domain-containing protein [Bacillus pumilus]|uniref:Peptidase S74 domain-containing protein n=1 Tax=Bacillus pumilus TaxID=1408 RepID=A0AAD0ML60_BACPU|nr:tail fiber domain-containing protein [Bacillus pumilus]AVM24342.1 hypothetical protein C5695_11030 [Bacillus pumilus]TYS42747.1 hypothetical protein FZC68_10070 [Bacillus pumilus]
MGFRMPHPDTGEYVPMAIELLKSDGVGYTAPEIKAKFDGILDSVTNLSTTTTDKLKEMADLIGDIGELAGDTGSIVDTIKKELNQRGINVKWLGAVGDGETDDTPAFLAAEALSNNEYPIFVPPGTYLADQADLKGNYFGNGAFLIVKEREAFNATAPPSQKRDQRLFPLTSFPLPILNEFYGKNSGYKITLDAYGNTSTGEESLKNLTSGKQNTAIGFLSQMNNQTQYSNVSIGGSSLAQGSYYSRTTAIGNNSLKWAGIKDPIVSRHELWFNEKDLNNIWNISGTDSYILKQMNPEVEKLIQPTGYPAPQGAVIVNEGGGFPAATSSSQVLGNTGIGRNALLQLVRGIHNTAIGYQALARSYTTEKCTAIGAFALANNLAGKENIGIGRNAMKYNQTGQKNIVIGNNAMGYDVFGTRNIFIGHQAGQRSNGNKNASHTLNTVIGTYAHQNKTDGEANVSIGARTLLNGANGSRNVVVGTEAGINYTGNNSIIIGNKAMPSSNQDRLLWIDYGNDGNASPFIYGDMGNNIMNLRANLRPDTDASQSLGAPSRRWANIYASNGTINTSDERYKQNITDIPDEWLDAWSEVDFCRFKFKDAVSEKGSSARWHIGVIAQRIDEVFKKHGLDATEIGLLCYDKWDSEFVNKVDSKTGEFTGETIEVVKGGFMWGIRADECQFLEMALMRRETQKMQQEMRELKAALLK